MAGPGHGTLSTALVAEARPSLTAIDLGQGQARARVGIRAVETANLIGFRKDLPWT